MGSGARVSEPCPCGRVDVRGRVRAFADCCEPCLRDTLPASDSETLMRSRYSAFVRGDVAYLQATWHVTTRPASLALDPAAQWLGLEVRAHRMTGEDTAEVEFVARYRVNGRAVRQHELSRFVREAGRWYYQDGDVR